MTEKIPWEPYSTKFAETEDAARSAKTVSAVRVTHNTHFRDNHVAECESEESCTCSTSRRAPSLTERCVVVATRLSLQNPVELTDEDDVVARLIAGVNIESFAVNGDGLDERPENPICETSEE